jgi:signal transduction histidine kinase
MSAPESLTGRLLLAALSHLDRADAAERDLIHVRFLGDLENKLLGSLDSGRTRETIAQVVLPELDAWTVVDVLEQQRVPRRLSVVHPSFLEPELIDVLNLQWKPDEREAIGYWAAARAKHTIVITNTAEPVLSNPAYSPEVRAALRALRVSACLVVPMWSDGNPDDRFVDGAITFMSTRTDAHFSADEITFAELVTDTCGRALRNSRLFESLDQRRLTAEREARSTSAMLGQVTHELRTPLAAIGGYAELMAMGIRGPVSEDQRQDLERIRWNQQHLLSLITQILSFVRADTGRIEFARTDMDLGAVARESIEMIGPLIAENRHIIEFEQCDPGVVTAVGDPDKVRQIAINLVTNALKYSAPDTRIVLRCGTRVADAAARAMAYMEVADAGRGISADQIEAVFRPFVQLPGSAAERQGGVGLGLAIARRLARGMGGDLSATSVVGQGSTFRLTLPADADVRRVGHTRP